MLSLTICHLYPELLNLYGDRGNIASLTMRLKWRGIDASICNLSLGDKFDPGIYDIVFLGGGQDFEQEILKNDLILEKGSAIKEAIENETVFLCICGGYQIMGKSYLTGEGREISCLSAIDFHTIAGDKRMIGDLFFTSAIMSENKPISDNLIIGFENHSGKTYLGNSVKPLGKVIKGYGNNGCDKTEGAIYKNVICSYSHGSLLPKNPKLADTILKKALARKYSEFTPEDFPELDDSYEDKARKRMISRYHVI